MTFASSIRQFFASFAGWATGLCALAAGATFLPWQLIPALGLHFPVQGIASPVGKVVLAVSLGLAVLFAVAGPRPARWQPLVLGGAAAALLAYCVWDSTSGAVGTSTTRFAGEVRTAQVYVPPGAEIYAEGALALAALLLSVVAFRRSPGTAGAAGRG